MSTLFDPDPFVPGFEAGPRDLEAKRIAETKAMAEVQAFEDEKRFVNQQIAENISVLGQSDMASQPIEISDSGRKA